MGEGREEAGDWDTGACSRVSHLAHVQCIVSCAAPLLQGARPAPGGLQSQQGLLGQLVGPAAQD